MVKHYNSPNCLVFIFPILISDKLILVELKQTKDYGKKETFFFIIIINISIEFNSNK
jgi:hypothetical protein